MSITPASLADVPELTALINLSYRGETSFKGWTTEAHLIDGQRIGTDDLTKQMNDLTALVLKNTNENNEITGCVYLQKKRDGILYLGMLTVSPLLQAQGLGKQLLAAAEDYARNNGCHTVEMTVLTTRTELISYYERRGYHKTGEEIPFKIPKNFGIPKQPLILYKLQKHLLAVI